MIGRILERVVNSRMSIPNNYIIIDQYEQKAVGVDLLIKYYGVLWKSIVDRMDCRFDGYVFTLYYKGNEYKVYRIELN